MLYSHGLCYQSLRPQDTIVLYMNNNDLLSCSNAFMKQSPTGGDGIKSSELQRGKTIMTHAKICATQNSKDAPGFWKGHFNVSVQCGKCCRACQLWHALS